MLRRSFSFTLRLAQSFRVPASSKHPGRRGSRSMQSESRLGSFMCLIDRLDEVLMEDSCRDFHAAVSRTRPPAWRLSLIDEVRGTRRWGGSAYCHGHIQWVQWCLIGRGLIDLGSLAAVALLFPASRLEFFSEVLAPGMLTHRIHHHRLRLDKTHSSKCRVPTLSSKSGCLRCEKSGEKMTNMYQNAAKVMGRFLPSSRSFPQKSLDNDETKLCREQSWRPPFDHIPTLVHH